MTNPEDAVVSTVMAHLNHDTRIETRHYDSAPIREGEIDKVAAINIGPVLTIFVHDLDTIAHLRDALYQAELGIAR